MAPDEKATRGSWATWSTPALRVGYFRVALALAAMIALADLLPFFREFLSDDGFMPRSALLDGTARLHRFSLLDAFGRPWMVAIYLLATYAALTSLLVGFRTRIASIASFLLVAGIYERNYAIFDGSDAVVRVLLFWTIFADSGAAFSVDARLRGSEDAEARAPFLPAWLIEAQVAYVYLATAVLKLANELWRNGTAVHNTLDNPHVFTRPWAAHYADRVSFVNVSTYGTLAFEFIFPLLVLVGRRSPHARLLAVVSGVGFHLGSWSMLNVGNFPIVMMASYAIYAEPAWLERPARWLDAKVLVPLATRLVSMGRESVPPSSVTRPALRDAVLVALFALACWTSLPKTELSSMPEMPAALRAIPQTMSIWQHWNMFAPAPVLADYRVVARGQTIDGTSVDPLREAPGGPIAVHGPELFYERWTKAMHGIAFGNRRTILPFARYLCRRWNGEERNDRSLSTFRLVRIERRIAPLGEPRRPYREVEIWQHACFAPMR